jgi:hypothetical protein
METSFMDESDTLTFIHHFSRTVACTMRVADEIPLNGQIQGFEY